LEFHSGRETDHSPPSSAKVKEWVELYLQSLNTPSWRGAQVGGAQGQLYLYLCFSEIISRHITYLELYKIIEPNLVKCTIFCTTRVHYLLLSPVPDKCLWIITASLINKSVYERGYEVLSTYLKTFALQYCFYSI
jgi:hypothetical protein